MNNRYRRVLNILTIVGIALCLEGCEVVNQGVLNPKGLITFQERKLLFDSLALMLIVVLPVIVMSFAFIFRYRQGHKTSDYKPNWSHSVLLEAIWWGVPCVIIIILGIMTWNMTHKLDPYKKIDVPGKPLQIKAVALPWKWLFIYPEQNIATVNYLKLPKNRQVKLQLTTDNVPMSAFFVPQLGSQIYTMAGMKTKLHLVPTQNATFEGLNSQYNGDGFSDMHFKVNVADQSDVDKWFETVKAKADKKLDSNHYKKLRQPSVDAPVQYYSGIRPGLFMDIIQSYQASEHP